MANKFRIGDAVQPKKGLPEGFLIVDVEEGGRRYMIQSLTSVAKTIGWMGEDELVLRIAVYPGQTGV